MPESAFLPPAKGTAPAPPLLGLPSGCLARAASASAALLFSCFSILTSMSRESQGQSDRQTHSFAPTSHHTTPHHMTSHHTTTDADRGFSSSVMWMLISSSLCFKRAFILSHSASGRIRGLPLSATPPSLANVGRLGTALHATQGLRVIE